MLNHTWYSRVRYQYVGVVALQQQVRRARHAGGRGGGGGGGGGGRGDVGGAVGRRRGQHLVAPLLAPVETLV